ncbi:tRNA modification enzyme [Trypanosoma rangeli SC58]|uniref:Threonylcarbamoyladenosine tRNA methylthiotransferase n=1 Tax=Trypanosoma rangeli SC58 TaxID=429131 RepID=A0A061IX35_TRYRA|nr:tRNA modification enzyme [Trypanosoma rangeli SC58]
MEEADMEDVFCADAAPTIATERSAFVNARRRNVPPAQRQDYGDGIPGNATVFVHTFGCGHNVSDGEYMAGLLAQTGYRITDVFNDADVYLLNSCTVKNPSEEHFISMMNRVRALGKPLVVAGCVPQADPKNTQWDDVSVIGVRSIDRVAQVIHEALQGNCVRLIGASEHAIKTQETNELPPLDLPKIRRNRFIEIIPISVGCLNHCTYCKTKQARGDLRSWPITSIILRVRSILKEGIKEIRLTSEDVGAYGIDINTDLVCLLRAIVKELEGTDVMLRVGMSNPPYLLRQLDDFAALLKHPNLYEFMHIPIQSGSNRVLEAMQREYSVEEFYECVHRIRSVVPNVTLATDIICAFPGEGEEEWRETMNVCDQVRFPVLNITRFYPRRNTPAAAMKQIPTEVAKRRTTELTEFFNSYRTFDHMIGEVHVVALLETAHDKHHLVGHTKAYVQVLVDPQEGRLGETVTVVITSTTKYSVRGRVLRSRWERLLAKATKTVHNLNWKSLTVFASIASASVAVTSIAMYKAALTRRQRGGG